jgi:hypothetical protein
MANIPVTTDINALLDADNLAASKPALATLGAVVTGGAATGLNMSTARILGRTTASAGAVEEITVGSGLSLTGGNLTATGTGTGDVSGPNSSTDNAIVRFNLATGKSLQNSVALVSDDGAITTAQNTGSIIPFYWSGSPSGGSFPVAADSHGVIAHSHADGAMYYSHTPTGGSASWVKMLAANTPVTLAQGGTGTASPAIVAGTNVTVSGTFPNQTINAAVKQGFSKIITAGNANSAEVYQSPLARFTLPASVSANGKIMIFTGDVYVKNVFSVQPNSGVYLFFRRYNETDHAKHFLITLPTASTPYKLSVSLGVLINTGSIVQEAFGRLSMIRTSISDTDGTTCVSVSDGNSGSLTVPEAANDLITIGQLIDIEFGILTVNSSGTVAGTYGINGVMEVSHF